MGHYAAEMMCNKCGNVRCTCPPTKTVQSGWVVRDFKVLSTDEDYAYQREKSPGTLFVHQMTRKVYKTRINAEKAAMKACEDAVQACRERLLELKHTLKTVRPWEEK